MRRRMGLVVVIALAALGLLSFSAIAAKKVVVPTSNFYGKSLTEWTEEYWRWWYSEYSPGVQPSLRGRIMFMPMPAGEQIGGDWTPENPAYMQGMIEVTIEPGTPFVLPFFAWLSERYNNGTPDDPVIPDSFVKDTVTNLEGDGLPVITLDGVPIVENFWDYYVGPVWLDPIIEYPEPSSYGSIGIIAFQGATIIMRPLEPGIHVLTLMEKMVITDEQAAEAGLPYSFGVIYSNTWVINVERAPKK